MTVPRIFLKKLLKENEKLNIEGNNFHYLIRVMRLRKGNKFFCVDETGREFEGEILDIQKNKLIAKFNFLKTDFGINYDLCLCYGLLKKDKNELVVSIASSIGVTKIVPVNMKRTMVKLEKDKIKAKIERLKKIAYESSRVSYISKEPVIQEITNLKEITFPEDALKILFSERMGLPNFIDCKEEIEEANNIVLFFGPEGGITEEEFNFLINNGFYPVSLGERVVKTEIAILYTLSVIRFIKNGKL